jgi:uncharacterized protein
VRDFRDPLYGFISVNDLEARVIEQRCFQRLRHILQLGPSFLVYPSATHSRFEHSIGTLEASTIMFDKLFREPSNRELLGWADSDLARSRSLLRLAALLHDVGHSPFSHASERLFPAGVDHERMTQRIIRETDVSTVIDDELGEGSADIVAKIGIGRGLSERDHLLLSEIITLDLGSDRLDYLRRDSHHLGVAYGRYDLHRFINGLALRTEEQSGTLRLEVEDGAVQSVEGILLARYFMFLQVYFHKTRRILDHHLTSAIESLLPGREYPVETEEYLDWDDHRVLNEFRTRREEEYVARVIGRAHYRCVFETLEHPQFHEVERFDWMKEHLADRFGDDVYMDQALKDLYNFVAPPIYVRTGEKSVPLKDRSSLVRSLKPISKMRVYAEPSARREVENACSEFRRRREAERGN